MASVAIFIEEILNHTLNDFFIHVYEIVAISFFALSDAFQENIPNIAADFFIVDIHGIEDFRWVKVFRKRWPQRQYIIDQSVMKACRVSIYIAQL